MSLIVHHLNNSRSQRILWLLEEIGAPYEIRYYDRDAVTNLAPPELIAVHPLGKSPVVTEDGATMAASSPNRARSPNICASGMAAARWFPNAAATIISATSNGCISPKGRR